MNEDDTFRALKKLDWNSLSEIISELPYEALSLIDDSRKSQDEFLGRYGWTMIEYEKEKHNAKSKD